MKIVSLQAENIKRLTAVEIRPDGALVQITGRNGAGKTSVLDSIWWALSNARHIQTAPIRAGASKAVIRLDLGELVVTRRFTRRDDETFTTTITVENADGARFGSPTTMLESLIGALTFDPLQFTRLEPKAQLQTLKAFVPGVDFAKIEAANAADFNMRTEINRLEKSLRTQADAIVVPDGTPTEAIDETALVTKLESAAQHNAAIMREQGRRENVLHRIEETARAMVGERDRVSRLRDEIARLEASLAESKAVITKEQGALNACPPIAEQVDTADVRRQIEAARATNRAVAQAKEKTGLAARALANEVAAGKLTKAMQDRAARVAKAVAAADLPIPGLAFGDGQVLLNGLPFSQASSAEQLRASMAIAMAGNPKLQVLRVKDGSLLDEAGLCIVAEMAEERGFQVWIERVETSGKIGFVIEDGALKGAAIREAAE